jgi:hypothetical protein
MTAARARMSDEEFRAMLDAKQAAVDECAAEIIGRLHNPVELSSYARRHETIVLALVLAKPDEPSAVSLWASTDGDLANVKTFPKSIIKIVHSEGDGRFVLATMKGYVAIERHLKQANIPGLAKSVKWTDDERAAWKLIQARISRVRHTLAEERRPQKYRASRKPIGTRNFFA